MVIAKKKMSSPGGDKTQGAIPPGYAYTKEQKDAAKKMDVELPVTKEEKASRQKRVKELQKKVLRQTNVDSPKKIKSLNMAEEKLNKDI